MRHWASKSESIFGEFQPGRKFADRPIISGWARFEHAKMLLETGQPFSGSVMLKGLAGNPSNKIFNRVVQTAIKESILTTQDVEFWKNALETRLPSMKQPSKEIMAIHTIFQQWDNPASQRHLLIWKARAHFRLSQYPLACGPIQEGLDHMREAKTLLDEYFQLSSTGQPPNNEYFSQIETPHNTLMLKVLLAEAEVWLGNHDRAEELLAEVVSQSAMDPDLGHLTSKARFWQILAEDNLANMSTSVRESRLTSILNEGQCNPSLACYIADDLVKIAQQRNDLSTAYAYYRDLANAVPNPALGFWARQRQHDLERVAPELVNTQIPSVIDEDLIAGWQATGDVSLVSESMKGPRRFPAWKEPQYGSDDVKRKRGGIQRVAGSDE